MSDWKLIQRNKPAVSRPVDLRLTLSLGYMLNGTDWYSQEQYNLLTDVDPIPWEDIHVVATLDQQQIFKSTVNNVEEISCTFQDTQQEQTHQLTLEITGIGDLHRPRWPTGQYGSAMLKITNICIENINLQHAVPTLGQYLLQDGTVNFANELVGNNGSYLLSFTTPIYSWLIQHSALILNKKY